MKGMICIIQGLKDEVVHRCSHPRLVPSNVDLGSLAKFDRNSKVSVKIIYLGLILFPLVNFLFHYNIMRLTSVFSVLALAVAGTAFISPQEMVSDMQKITDLASQTYEMAKEITPANMNEFEPVSSNIHSCNSPNTCKIDQDAHEPAENARGF